MGRITSSGCARNDRITRDENIEDGDTESENASTVIQDFVFLCRKIGSINGYFL